MWVVIPKWDIERKFKSDLFLKTLKKVIYLQNEQFCDDLVLFIAVPWTVSLGLKLEG
jgi:hypothetical protein